MYALVMYDRQTDTLWSQFLSRGVRGPLSGTQLEIVPSLQANWEQWLELHPDTQLLDKGGRYNSDSYQRVLPKRLRRHYQGVQQGPAVTRKGRDPGRQSESLSVPGNSQ